MMSVWKWMIALCAVALVGLGSRYLTAPSNQTIVQTGSLQQIPRQSQGTSRATGPSNSSAAVVTKSSPAVNYKRALRQSTDYWALAHTLLPAAKAGDADAQYYLWKILDGCRYFDGRLKGRD